MRRARSARAGISLLLLLALSCRGTSPATDEAARDPDEAVRGSDGSQPGGGSSDLPERETPSGDAELGDGLSGGQTSDFGDGLGSACRLQRSDPIGVEEARALEAELDAHLAMLDSRLELPFHRGNFDCGSTPERSGTLVMDTTLVGLEIERYGRAPGAPEDVLCEDVLAYLAQVDFGTSSGTIAGSLSVRAIAVERDRARVLSVAAEDRASAFAGSLGVRADRTRPHQAYVTAQFFYTSGDGAFASDGELRTRAVYADGSAGQDLGEGIFWPLAGRACDWLEGDATSGSEIVPLDAYAERD